VERLISQSPYSYRVPEIGGGDEALMDLAEAAAGPKALYLDIHLYTLKIIHQHDIAMTKNS
jgi:hypothetical protein